MDQPRSLSSSHQSHAFAARPQTMNVHWLEWLLLVFASAHLCFLPWAIGTMQLLPQQISFVCSIIALFIAILPRRHTEIRTPRGGALTLNMLPRLFKFPIFWFGLLFLAYITIQALNPAWELMTTTYLSKGRPLVQNWLQPLHYVEWLPTSISAPFQDREMNPWRAVMIYSSAWFVACALWTGITRRKSIRILLTVLAVNGTLFALIGIIQKATNSYEMLWLIPAPRFAPYFFSSMVYKNHAAAYINLAITLSAALMLWNFIKPTRPGEARATPLYALFIITSILALVMTQSRGAVLICIVFILISGLVFIVQFFRNRDLGISTIIPLVAVLLVISALLVVGAKFTHFEKYLVRYERTLENLEKGTPEGSYDMRVHANQVTHSIIQEKPVTGWGIGSFRYVFQQYNTKDDPRIGPIAQRMKYQKWEYAHNDYLQMLLEVGWIGSALAVLTLLAGACMLLANRFYRYPQLIIIVLGLIGTLAHCYVDFQSHNPAILLLWTAMAVLTIAWAKIETRERSHS